MSRYSQLYIERGRPVGDSERFRRRLAAWAIRYWEGSIRVATAGAIYETLGVKMAADFETIVYDSELERFFLKAEMRDVLDTVTIATPHLTERGLAKHWLGHVSLALREENLAFRLGEKAVVQPFIDAQFDLNRTTALEALSVSRFGEARADFEAAFRHLRNGEGKQAIRMMFPAVEVAAKVLHPGALARLMPNEVDRYILPRLRAKYEGNAPALVH